MIIYTVEAFNFNKVIYEKKLNTDSMLFSHTKTITIAGIWEYTERISEDEYIENRGIVCS